jgi:orotate phosphoribosyltransferase
MGNLNSAKLKQELFDLLNREALKRGKFLLSSGRESNYYLDGRVITLSPQGAYLVANIILTMIDAETWDAVGGPTLGADPIVGALAAVSYINKQPVKTFIVRKQAKEHGTQQQVEGPALQKGDRVILVDDVATSGKAILEAKQALDKIGVVAEKAIVIVDRNQGAAENLAQAGLKPAPTTKIFIFSTDTGGLKTKVGDLKDRLELQPRLS